MRLDYLTGTELAGALKVSEAALNELLNHSDSPMRGATITVNPDNQLVFRHGPLRARVMVGSVIEVGTAPRVRLRLASFLVALALQATVRQRYVHVKGREITISVADLPALHALRDVWPHVKRAGVRTEDRSLVMEFTISVTE